MKLRKLVSAAAAVMAAGVMTVSAGAVWVVPTDCDPGLKPASGNWLVQVYNEGSEAEGKPATDYGIDYSKVKKLAVTFNVLEEDREWFEGGLGGALVLSINGGDIEHYEKDAEGKDVETALWQKYNWTGEPTKEWWGVYDEELELATRDPDKAVMTEKVGDYTYKITSDEYNNPLENGDASKIGCMQVAVMEWGDSMNHYEVLRLDVMDKDNNVLITFDGKGVATVGGTPEPTYPWTKNEETSSDATSSDAASSDATSSDAASSDTNSSAPASSANANSSVTTAPAENESEPPVGLIVGIIAGVAVVAVVVVVIVLKKKKG